MSGTRIICTTITLCLALILCAIADAGLIDDADGWGFTASGIGIVWFVCLWGGDDR